MDREVQLRSGEKVLVAARKRIMLGGDAYHLAADDTVIFDKGNDEDAKLIDLQNHLCQSGGEDWELIADGQYQTLMSIYNLLQDTDGMKKSKKLAAVLDEVKRELREVI